MKNSQSSKKNLRNILTREKILEAALEILDEKGIENLSMRSLGTKLGVEAMSLYNHIRNKDELIDSVLDLVLDKISVPSQDSNWRDAMYLRALSARQAFQKHPWASALIDSRLESSPARMNYYEKVLSSLVRAGFTFEEAAHAFSLLDSYLYGFELQRRNMRSSGEEDAANKAEIFSHNLESGDYPYLSRMVEISMDAGYDEDADFKFGLNLILDGLEKLLSEKGEGAK